MQRWGKEVKRSGECPNERTPDGSRTPRRGIAREALTIEIGVSTSIEFRTARGRLSDPPGEVG